MIYPPLSYQPGNPRIYNGRAARSADAIEVDRFAAWLGAVIKPQPQFILCTLTGTNASAGQFRVPLHVPPHTRAISCELLATGSGTVTLESDGDAYDVDIAVGNDDSEAHEYEHAAVFATGPLIDPAQVSTNGMDRALNVTPDPEWTLATVRVYVVDFSVSQELRVWALRFRFVPLSEGTQLAT